MKRPRDAFFGTMMVFLVPSHSMNSETDLVRCLVLFPILGAAIGTVLGRLRHRLS